MRYPKATMLIFLEGRYNYVKTESYMIKLKQNKFELCDLENDLQGQIFRRYPPLSGPA